MTVPTASQQEKTPGPIPRSAQDRLKDKKQNPPPQEGHTLTFLQKTRGYVDALVFAYLLAMFIRTFVFELFMIPTGSMTPTLIGDGAGEAAFADYDGDQVQDVIYTSSRDLSWPRRTLQIFLMNADGTYKDLLFLRDVSHSQVAQIAMQTERRRDMIIVNKFAYWFSRPERGDIAVFKVPRRPNREQRWEVDKPVYIKRVVGLPGETITIQPSDRLELGPGDPNRYGERWGGTEIHLQPRPVLADGVPVENGSLGHLVHFPRPRQGTPGPKDPVDIESVPPDGVLMLGDNATSSSDGRYWGYVPLRELRGKAVLRYWPLKGLGFLDRNRKTGSR